MRGGATRAPPRSSRASARGRTARRAENYDGPDHDAPARPPATGLPRRYGASICPNRVSLVAIVLPLEGLQVTHRVGAAHGHRENVVDFPPVLASRSVRGS